MALVVFKTTVVPSLTGEVGSIPALSAFFWRPLRILKLTFLEVKSPIRLSSRVPVHLLIAKHRRILLDGRSSVVNNFLLKLLRQ